MSRLHIHNWTSASAFQHPSSQSGSRLTRCQAVRCFILVPDLSSIVDRMPESPAFWQLKQLSSLCCHGLSFHRSPAFLPCDVLSVLSMSMLSRLTSPGWFVEADLSRLFFQAYLYRLTLPSCPVLIFRFPLSSQNCPIPLSRHGCPVPVILF